VLSKPDSESIIARYSNQIEFVLDMQGGAPAAAPKKDAAPAKPAAAVRFGIP
jgi:hypothetical protein